MAIGVHKPFHPFIYRWIPMTIEFRTLEILSRLLIPSCHNSPSIVSCSFSERKADSIDKTFSKPDKPNRLYLLATFDFKGSMHPLKSNYFRGRLYPYQVSESQNTGFDLTVESMD